MSAYPGPGNYSPHQHNNPHPQLHQQQHIQIPIHSPGGSSGNGGGHHDEPLSAQSQHHHQSYSFDHQSAQQIPTSSPYNGHLNGHSHGHGHVQDGRLDQQRPTSVPPSAPANGGGEQAKSNRLRKACDSCSIRKVKCDETGPPCRACAALEIPCTFERPSKRRGPPNRHAEEIKKQEEIKRRKLEEPGSDAGQGGLTSPSPNHAAETLASFPYHNVLSAESICPMSILVELVDDFFTYIHPLCPFPHEQSFRHSLGERDDKRHPGFLALLASMIGALVASFPRRPRKHLKGQNLEHLFPTSISLVDRCHKVAVEARGPGYLDKELRVYDAVTSYFLGLAGAYTFRWKQTRLYFGETLTIIRVLGAHKADDPGFMTLGDMPATFGGGGTNNSIQTLPHVDHIEQQVGRRLFWVMFVGIGSIQQLGSSFGELIMPPNTPSDPYPPLPLEVDDEYITVNQVGPQPEGIISKIAGFNLNVKVYLTTMPIASMELAYGMDEVFDWTRQKRILDGCLRKCKDALQNAPPALLLHARLGAPLSDSQFDPAMSESSNMVINGGMGSEWQLTRSGGGDGADTQDPQILRETKRQLQYEIQKANIYASQLGTRSYIVEKYCSLQETHERMSNNSGTDFKASPSSPQGSLGQNVMMERESIVKDLLIVLNSINQINMEPNGGSFVGIAILSFSSCQLTLTPINKIRQIASTLVDSAPNRKGPLAIQADEYLNQFLGYLMRLERPDESGDDDKGWADLREYQLRFAQNGGFMSEL